MEEKYKIYNEELEVDEVHQYQMDSEEDWIDNIIDGYESNLFNDAE